MPKNQVIDPAEVRKPGKIVFRDIPINQYALSVKDERGNYSNDALLKIYRDMRIIREFETMLQDLKQEGAYCGIEYAHKGPAHLSIGQEAAAVGMAYELGVEDHIYGSHRSHGEILAKGLRAIELLDDAALLKIMRGHLGGDTLSAVEKHSQGSVKDLAVDFLTYGALAEMFARNTGLNRGLGGSMHAFFPPFGIYPNNAIVGGSGDIATGAALYKRVNRKPGIVVCNIGDASMGCGPVWEGITFAAMDQYRTLWDKDLGGGLPIVYNFFNNFYGMGGQTAGETMGYGVLARVGAGVNPDQLHAERVDGYNPLAVIDAFRRKKKVIAEGRGPVLLDTITYRLSGHSPSDAMSYRTKEEVDLWAGADCIADFGEKLVASGVAASTDIANVDRWAKDLILKAYKLSIDDGVSPRTRIEGDAIGKLMLSNERIERMEERAPEVLMPLAENPRVVQIAKRARYAFEDGKKLSKARVMSYRDALFEAIAHRFYVDPTLCAYGEENRDWGGAFAVYRGLTEALPYHRLFNAPISEGAICGTAVGYALEGGRVIAELMYCDFMGRAGDEIFNQLSKWQSMSAGILKMPAVIRVSVGSKYGAQHSQDWSAITAHIPGLKVVFPATPYDAKGLMNSALVGTDPVIFFESQRIYDVGEEFEEGGVPEGYYEIPIGEPSIKRTGNDLTLINIGATLYRVRDAADRLAEKYGVGAEIVDLRSLVPLNYEPLIASVKKTGRAVIVCDACERASFAHTLASNISAFAFAHLDAPPAVVASRNWITPAAELEDVFFPQVEWIIDTIHERVLPLPGHRATTNQTLAELLRRNRLGI